MSVYATTHQVEDPIIYDGSHIMPDQDSPRGGAVDVATVPYYLDPPMRVVRLSVSENTGPHATVLLDVDQVRELRDALTAWLAAEV